MKITRSMVAKRAGVTAETVSYVLNSSRPVSKKTREKVLNAVEELGYVPDIIARSMVKNSTMSIAVICENLSNPYYSEILHGIEDSATAEGYSVLICDSASNFHKNISDLIARRVDGVISLAGRTLFTGEVIEKFKRNNIPIALTHSSGARVDGVMQLEPDFENGIRQGLMHYKELGLNEVVFLSGYTKNYRYDDRCKLFTALHTEIFDRMPLIIEDLSGEFTFSAGYNLAKELVGQRQGCAVLAGNDMLAIGAMNYLQGSGFGVPKDFSVMGIDNIAFTEFVSPKLTTIGYDKVKYGEELVRMLLHAIGGGEPIFKKFAMELCVRLSA